MAIASIARLGSGRVSAISAGAIIVAACIVLAIWLAAERRRMIEQGYRSGSNLAHVLKEQVAGAIDAIDLTLQGVSDTIALLPGLPEHDPAFEESLRQKLPRLPFVRAIFIVGADGFITQDTDHPFTPRTNLSDRAYFKAHLENARQTLHIGQPVRSRSTATWFVSLSRRLNRPDGTFAGIVVAALEVNRFAAFYRLLDLGPNDAINLFLRDGTFLLRVPEGKASIGQSESDLPLFSEHLPITPNGSFRLAASFDGRPRLISYRTLDHAPIVVSISVDEEALLAPWGRELYLAIGAFLAFALTIAGLVMLFAKTRSRYRQADERRLHAQRLETLGRMTGGIAHDVNNCLAIISGGTRLLARDGTASDAEILSRMNEAVRHGSALMAQLLSFAKQQPLDLRPVDISERLVRLKSLLRQAVRPEIRISTELPSGLWPCRADQTQFDAAILNLAVNAADAMPAGGWIRIGARNLRLAAQSRDFQAPAGDYVELRVADTGQGMPPETMRRAIEPFFSTKGERGTGLGLSQVYGFMQQIGGDLRIESRVGQGTSVRLLFPRAVPEVAGESAGTSRDPASRHAARTG